MKNKMIFERAHRILRHLSDYHRIEDISSEIADFDIEADLQNGEILIGVYRNVIGDTFGNIVISNLGVYILKPSSIDFIGYRTIRRVELSTETEKTRLDHLIVHLTDGKQKNIHITGGRGKFRDVFEFSRFLDRARYDVIKATDS